MMFCNKQKNKNNSKNASKHAMLCLKFYNKQLDDYTWWLLPFNSLDCLL